MHESNRGSEDESTPPFTLRDPLASTEILSPPPSEPIAEGPPVMPGLWTWFTIIAALGLAGIVWQQAELGLSVALAGAFVAAHAADRDENLSTLHRMLSAAFVMGGAAVFAVMAYWLATQSNGVARPLAVGIAGGSAVLCLVTAFRPFADALAAALFRTVEPNHVLRLGARMVMMVLLFAIPGWAAFPGVIDTLAESGKPLVDAGQMLSSVVGLSVLALGAVGFMIRRDWRATLDRLGLRAPKPSHLVVVVVGVVALYLLNTGSEALQRAWLPDLWRHDQEISRLIAGGLGVGGSVMLGVTAGVGEELSMRGALQPRLGLVLTALSFAALHVQYSWFGIATIFVLGVVLGLIRNRTSTTIAILVHSLYDIAAVFTVSGR